MSIVFDFIERSESPRLADTTYPTIMQWYKILARILLLFSVIDFALTAPVVVREHEVVDSAKDGLANAADRINVPRTSDSGHGWEHEPKQRNPRPRIGPDDSPEPSLPEKSLSFSAWMPHSPSGSDSWGSGGSGWKSLSSSNPGSPDPDELSTAESVRPPSAEQPKIGHPPPAPPSEPELSTKPLPPGAQSLAKESNARISAATPSDEVKAARILMAMSRHGLKPRAYDPSAVDTAEA